MKLTPRNAKRVARPPVRTLKEMSEELGVGCASLASLLRWRNGPKAALVSRNPTVHWYEPKAFREWWKTVSADLSTQDLEN